MFLFVPDNDISKYVDNNTPHAINKHLENVLKNLEQGSDFLLRWFTDNPHKAIPEKYHLLLNVGGGFEKVIINANLFKTTGNQN